jgi:hypothetical protein
MSATEINEYLELLNDPASACYEEDLCDCADDFELEDF